MGDPRRVEEGSLFDLPQMRQQWEGGMTFTPPTPAPVVLTPEEQQKQAEADRALKERQTGPQGFLRGLWEHGPFSKDYWSDAFGWLDPSQSEAREKIPWWSWEDPYPQRTATIAAKEAQPAPAVTEPPPAPARTSTSVVGAPYPQTPTDLPGPSTLNVLDERGEVTTPDEWKTRAMMREHLYPTKGAVDPVLGTGSFDVRSGPGGFMPSVQVPATAGMNFDTYQNELARLEGTNQLAAQILRERWAVDHPAVAANTEQRQAEANINLTQAQAEKARHTPVDDYQQALSLVPTAMLQVAQEWGIDPAAIMEAKKEDARQKSIILARADPELKTRKIDPIKNPQEFETIRKKWELRLLANYVTQEADKRMNRAQEPVQAAIARTGFGYVGNQ